MPLSAAFRSLARAPALAFGVIVTLALGVGALTTACGVVNAGLWRQPPFPDAGRLKHQLITKNISAIPRVLR